MVVNNFWQTVLRRLVPVLLVSGAQAALAGTPLDWSHRNVINSAVETEQSAQARGALAEFEAQAREPRYRKQLANAKAKERELRGVSGGGVGRPRPVKGGDTDSKEVKRDWAYVMGFAKGEGVAGAFPAKYGDIATTNCATDFVVYPSGTAGATSAGQTYDRYLDFDMPVAAGDGITVNDSSGLSFTITASTTLNTGTNFQISASTTTMANNFVAAFNRNFYPIQVFASVGGGGVADMTVRPYSQGTLARLSYTSPGISSPGFVNGTGTQGQPTIFAFNNLYKSCAGNVPGAYWSYNTGTGAVVETSPVISEDGSQVAFVQRDSGGSSLMLLKWSSSTPASSSISVPYALTAGTLGAYRSCTAPCMTKVSLTTNTGQHYSSPFYDYLSDVLFVGDAVGKLHKFTGVFKGTPAESSSGFPVTMGSTSLSSPVYDPLSGLVFAGSLRTGGAGGSLYSVSASSGGTALVSAVLAGNNYRVTDPVVDFNAQKVYAFVGGDTSTSCGGSSPCRAVYQFPTNSSISGSSGVKVQVGRANTAFPTMYSGMFDETYFGSANPASPTGNLYVCGSPTATAQRPTLWRIPITSNSMGSPVVGPTLVNANSDCSPITQIKNNGVERLFVSVTAGGSQATCTGGCMYMFNLAGTWNASLASSAGLPALDGTGGIIVDGIATTSGASQIYYATTGSGTNPGLAIQASQAALD